MVILLSVLNEGYRDALRNVGLDRIVRRKLLLMRWRGRKMRCATWAWENVAMVRHGGQYWHFPLKLARLSESLLLKLSKITAVYLVCVLIYFHHVLHNIQTPSYILVALWTFLGCSSIARRLELRAREEPTVYNYLYIQDIK